MAIAVAGCGGGATPAASSRAAAASSAAPAASSAAAAGGLHLPGQLFGLSRNTGPLAKQGTRQLISDFSGSSIMRSPVTALYGTGSTPDVLVLAGRWTSATAHRMASAAADKTFATRGTLSGGGTDGQPFPAGPHGGALYCGHAPRTGPGAFVCVWADKVTFGLVFYIAGSASSLSDAASKTNQVRSAIGN